MLKYLLLIVTLLLTLFAPFFANATVYEGFCPCPGISGPANICPNVQRTISVTNAPSNSIVSFATSNGNIVSQSGVSAIINQPGTYTATVCFQLSINVPQGTNCGVNCNNPLVSAILTSNPTGNPVTICETGPTSVALTCNANVAVTPGTTTYRFFSDGVLVGESASNILNVGLGSFTGSLASYTCQIVTQSGQCVSATSNSISILRCAGGGVCPTVGAILSSNQPGNPSTLTICPNPPGPSTIVLTCKATSAISDNIAYRFLRDGAIVAESASNTFTVTLSQFEQTSLASFTCQVVTRSGACVGTSSNAITIQRCAGGGVCPIPGRPTLQLLTGNLCELKTSQLICIPAECSGSSDTQCISQFRYQLIRSTGFFAPGPTANDYQFNFNNFYVTPLAGETFTCRVARADPECVGAPASAASNSLSSRDC